MSDRVLLVVSNSYDTTTDLLVHRLGAEKVFRFNFDIWSDYAIEITSSSFQIVDPVGRSAGPDNIAKVLWRKPWSRGPYRPASITDEDRFYDQEVWYAVRDIVNLLWRAGRVVLVEPYAERRAGKFLQMRIAAKHLRVPAFQFRLRRPSVFMEAQTVVVKSLTSETVGPAEKRELLFTTKVGDNTLSPECPWMVQTHVDAEKDVTVAFVYDQLFAFELDRTSFRATTPDWRELPTDRQGGQWIPHSLPDGLSRHIFAFMRDMGLQFGRLDFLKASFEYYFLEVNTNGEWAWLDTQGHYGLLPKVVMEVDPDTVLHSIPAHGLL